MLTLKALPLLHLEGFFQPVLWAYLEVPILNHGLVDREDVPWTTSGLGGGASLLLDPFSSCT